MKTTLGLLTCITRSPAVSIPLIITTALLVGGCPQEPKNSVELLDKCREIVNEQVQERGEDLEGDRFPNNNSEPIGGKQGTMLELCQRKQGADRSKCDNEAADWSIEHLKKLQDDKDKALEFCQAFIDKHKEFDTATNEQKKAIKKSFIELGQELAKAAQSALLKKSIGLRNLIKDDSRAVANMFRMGLGTHTPVPSYAAAASGAVTVRADRLRLSIATGSLEVTDFTGTQSVPITGSLAFRDRGSAGGGVRILEPTGVHVRAASFMVLGLEGTGINTGALSEAQRGYATLDGTTLTAVVPVTVENDILPLDFVTMMVPLTGTIDTTAGTFTLSSSGSALDLYPVEAPGSDFLMTSFDVTGVATGGSIRVTTVPGNIRGLIPTRAGETATEVAENIAAALEPKLAYGRPTGVVANTGLLFFVGLSADEVSIQSRDPGLRIELVP